MYAPIVSGDDDELIKITVRFNAYAGGTLPAGLSLQPDGAGANFSIALAPEGNAATTLKLYKSADKNATGAYTAGDPLPLTLQTPGVWTAEVYAEGIVAHTVQRAAGYKAEFRPSGILDNAVCNSPPANITVLGIASMQWKGIGNGWTSGNGKNDSDVLDTHPSLNGAPDHVRVFSEGKYVTIPKPSVSPPKELVKLNIQLSTAPVETLPVYLRVFDMDDPEDAGWSLDPNDIFESGNYEGTEGGANRPLTYDKHHDNRGLAGGQKCGLLHSPAGGFSPIDASKGVYSKQWQQNINSYEFLFTVSKHPGDNYAAACYGDLDFVEKWRNYDQYDKNSIVFETAADCPPIHTSLVSQTLTVWRTLHIEYDRMRNPNWIDNLKIPGDFYDFEGDAGGGSLIHTKRIKLIRAHEPAGVSWSWDATKPLKDGSSSTGNGRFQNGWITIGKTPELVIGEKILKNGDDHIEFPTTADLTASGALQVTLIKGSQTNVFSVVDIVRNAGVGSSGPDFLVYITNSGPAAIDISVFNGGTASFNGGPACAGLSVVPGENNRFSILHDGTKSNLIIPITVYDDDDIPLVGNSTLIGDIDVLGNPKEAFGQVYIDVAVDGGGRMANNDANIDFSRNLNNSSSSDLYSGEPFSEISADNSASEIYEHNHYWVVYLLGAWQYLSSRDNDPDSGEASNGGVTGAYTHNCQVVSGGDYTALFFEPTREKDIAFLGEVITHEIGHQFGLNHGVDEYTGIPADYLFPGGCLPNCSSGIPLITCHYPRMGIMSPADLNGQPPFFIDYHKNLIRNRVKSPGK